MCVCKTDQKRVSEEELWVQEIIAVEVGFIASCGIKQWSDLYTVILSVGESPPGKHCYGFVFIVSVPLFLPKYHSVFKKSLWKLPEIAICLLSR